MIDLRSYQNKPLPTVDGEVKTSVTTLMAFMAAGVVRRMNRPFLLVLDAYFAVGPVFAILKDVVDAQGQRLVHVITRAESNAVGYQEPPPRTGLRGAPRKYGDKVSMISLFDKEHLFQEIALEIYRERKTILFYCIDLIWKPIKQKVRFVLVKDGNERFILLTSDLTLSPQDIITAYSHRFKIEVTFKVMKHLLGVFFYHFWTSGWPKIGKNNQSVISSLIPDHKRLIVQATNAIEGFVNFGCIATGTLQILALKHHEKIWQSYRRWLRTYTSYIPSEEVVRSVIQEEFLHNFHSFRNSAIYRIIMSKSRKNQQHQLPMVA